MSNNQIPMELILEGFLEQEVTKEERSITLVKQPLRTLKGEVLTVIFFVSTLTAFYFVP